MAILTLIRHGQASFLAANYDRLSPLGERQSAILGQYWAANRIQFDRIYCGPAQRHLGTMRHACQALRGAGFTPPDPLPLPEADEYDGIEVMRQFLPTVAERHEDVRQMEAQFRASADKSHAAPIFERLFQRVTRLWAAGELHSPAVESWQEFCARVDRGIENIRAAAPKNANIAVFTSGGVIAAAVRSTLQLTPERTLELSWTSRNASFTEFLFSGDRFSLHSFNNIPHLNSADLVTYR